MEALVNGQSSHPVQKPVVMDSNRVLDYATHPSLSVRLLGIVLVILIKFSIANWQLVKVRSKPFKKNKEVFRINITTLSSIYLIYLLLFLLIKIICVMLSDLYENLHSIS